MTYEEYKDLKAKQHAIHMAENNLGSVRDNMLDAGIESSEFATINALAKQLETAYDALVAKEIKGLGPLTFEAIST